ncbi:MAG: SDR family oxidoreductase [Deltaproteobacteria bacterium]|nr:MAG: SDR family oxidoreductase [Deltaproteobacteria bacterium]
MKVDNTDTIFITGATGILGRAFTLGFADEGANIVFTSRGGGSADQLRKECLAHGAKQVLCIQTDLLSDHSVPFIIEELKKSNLLPNILINNARNADFIKPTSDGLTPRESWRNEFMLGVILPYELTMAIAGCERSPLKSVINISSIYGITAPNLTLYDHPSRDSSANYGVTKAALIHLTKELAVRLAPLKIRVNAISYGGVKGRADIAFQDRYGKLCPSGKMLEVSEVFGAVKYLSSSNAAGVTGHNLVVDGGWTIW